jgi:hypothetical protein
MKGGISKEGQERQPLRLFYLKSHLRNDSKLALFGYFFHSQPNKREP